MKNESNKSIYIERNKRTNDNKMNINMKNISNKLNYIWKNQKTNK